MHFGCICPDLKTGICETVFDIEAPSCLLKSFDKLNSITPLNSLLQLGIIVGCAGVTNKVYQIFPVSKQSH